MKTMRIVCEMLHEFQECFKSSCPTILRGPGFRTRLPRSEYRARSVFRRGCDRRVCVCRRYERGL
jgi:hypothetical protein